jgi:hypothetical protein
MKLLYGVIVLAFAPLVFAGNGARYPSEKIAAFVFEKVDVTTLPSAIRPKKIKNKKTFGDYGYVAREVEKKALLDRRKAPKPRLKYKTQKRNCGVNSQASGKERQSSTGAAKAKRRT